MLQIMSLISVCISVYVVYKIIGSNLPLVARQLFSFILTFVTYLLFFNWKVALVICVGISFHEYCHILAAHKVGIPTKGFFLIPFLGGIALMDKAPSSRKDQAIIYLMGPLGGGLFSILIGVIYLYSGIPIIGQAAIWMIYINLFNLLPFSILDGGQLLSSVTYSINRTLGLFSSILSTIIAIVILWSFNPAISVLVFIYGGLPLIVEAINWNNVRLGKDYLVDNNYFNIPLRQSRSQMLITLFAWTATIGILYYSKYYLEQNFNLNPFDLFKP